MCFFLFARQFYAVRSDLESTTCNSPQTDDSYGTIRVTRLTSNCPLQSEGPFWDELTQALYYVDTVENAVHKFDYKTNRDTFAYLEPNEYDRNVSAIFTIKGESDQFIATYDRYVYRFCWDGKSKTVENFTKIFTIEDRAEFQCNDAKVSPSGVFFVGTAVAPFDLEVAKKNPHGYIVAVRNGEKKIVQRDWPFANGLAWSIDEKRMYIVDSLFTGLYAFDYNKFDVTIRNKRPVFNFAKYNIAGFPDGQAADTRGNLWIATFNGTELIYINPYDGILLKRVKINGVFGVTSVALGGPYLNELFVTTSSRGQKSNQFFPYSGCLFKVTGTNTRGFPGVPVDRSVFSKKTCSNGK